MNFGEDDAVITNILRMCRQSSILDYYSNLNGNNCTDFLTNIDEKIRLDDSSMIVYYRNIIHLEKSCIYNSFLNDYYRKIITRWRLSSHKLKVETERYSRNYVPRQSRVCLLCNILEDENHVVFVCPIYQLIRAKFQRLLSANTDIKSILNPNNIFVVETAQLLYDIEAMQKELCLQ